MFAAALFGIACLAPSAAAASGRTSFLPPPVPKGRALAALSSHPHVLLAVEPGLDAERLVAGQGGVLVSSSLNVWRVGGGASARLVPELDRLGLLRYAEPDRVRRLTSHLELGDPLISKAWFLQRVGADVVEPPGQGVAVTIIDTGLDVNHPDFLGREGVVLLNELSPVEWGSAFYHGTFVASTVGAAANGVGSVGVYPTSALRIYELPSLEDSDIIAAMDKVAKGGVLNLSIGGPGYSRALYESVMRVVDRGVLVVTAGGNSFFEGNPDIYPADYPHVLTVASTDEDDKVLFFSSGNQAVDLAAPGSDIPVQDPTDPEDFALADGTSFSAPIVSGIAAWVWTVRSKLDSTQVFELLRSSAHDVGKPGFDTRTGSGRVDLPAALAAEAPMPDPGEPNDDVDLITAGKVLSQGEPPLTRPGRGGATVAARLSGFEDPRDVYRVFVPARRTIGVTVVPDANVNVALWKSGTKSVLGKVKNRLAVSARPGGQTETIEFRNATNRGVTIFVEVWIPGGRGSDSAEYVLSVRTR